MDGGAERRLYYGSYFLHSRGGSPSPYPCGRQGPAVIHYRPFRNTDPPGLVEVWNETATGRGAFPLRTPGMLERWVFGKPYFDHDALIVAEDRPDDDDAPRRVVGFALAGFGPNEDQTALDTNLGVICNVVVRPGDRKHGVGRELFRRAEAYLTARGATDLRVGSQTPNNPYLFGLYGGSNSPGLLESDGDVQPFLASMGYERGAAVRVFQRKLDKPLDVADPRFGLIRKRYDVQLLKAAVIASWWEECVWGGLEPAEFRLVDKLTNLPAARATAWELEGFGWRWNAPSAGIIDVQVRPDLRQQGLAKFLVTHILRFLQDQFFGIGELQARADDPASVKLCESVGFEQVDVGYVYRKTGEAVTPPPPPPGEGITITG
jgi:ribosomal protein S18 acetylase RimI-like enzyme